MIIVAIKEMFSKSELISALEGTKKKFFLLGSDAQYRACYFLVNDDRISIAIGIITHKGGLTPMCMLLHNHIFVGYNNSVDIYDIEGGRQVNLINALAPFYEFLLVQKTKVIAIFEIEVYCLSETGDEIWRMDTDLIVDYSIECDKIRIEQDGANSLFISLKDGSRIE